MAEAAGYRKEYIDVEVHFASDGTMLPRIIQWRDGRKYEIDRVLTIKPAPAVKAGGQGDRYTVMIGGQQRYLFLNTTRSMEQRRLENGLWKGSWSNAESARCSAANPVFFCRVCLAAWPLPRDP